MENEILIIIAIVGPFLWAAHFIGYKYICSEERIYLLGVTKYTKMDIYFYGFKYLLFVLIAIILLFSFYIYISPEKGIKIFKNLFSYLGIVILLYLFFDSRLSNAKKSKRKSEIFEIFKHKFRPEVIIKFYIIIGLIFFVCGPIMIVLSSISEFQEIINKPSWNLITFLFLFLAPVFLNSIFFAKADAIIRSFPWSVRLIIDKKKIGSMREWRRIKGLNVTGNSIEGILAKETDDQIILYIEKPERNIFVNKAYVIALIDMYENEDLEQSSQLKEGEYQNKITEEN